MPILLINAFATWALVGLIWTIQLVHYALFDAVGPAGWGEYHRRHMTNITVVVGPLMLVEAATAVALVVWRPIGVPSWPAWIGLAIVVALWVSTAVWQVPLHQKLAQGHDVDLARALTRSNWLRTFLWTVRGLLVAWMIWTAWTAAKAAEPQV